MACTRRSCLRAAARLTRNAPQPPSRSHARQAARPLLSICSAAVSHASRLTPLVMLPAASLRFASMRLASKLQLS